MSELWEVLTEHLPEFSSGLWVTFRLVAIAFVIAMVVGTLVAAHAGRAGQVAEPDRRHLRRDVPQRPAARPPDHRLLRASRGPASRSRSGSRGSACLGLYTAAYIAEALRSGVFAVGKGQVEAALSLGLTYPRTMRRIILPQAFRTVIPALGSLVIAMIKNSAIVGGSLVALPDLLKQTREVQADTAQPNEVYFWGAVGFLS